MLETTENKGQGQVSWFQKVQTTIQQASTQYQQEENAFLCKGGEIHGMTKHLTVQAVEELRLELLVDESRMSGVLLRKELEKQELMKGVMRQEGILPPISEGEQTLEERVCQILAMIKGETVSSGQLLAWQRILVGKANEEAGEYRRFSDAEVFPPNSVGRRLSSAKIVPFGFVREELEQLLTWVNREKQAGQVRPLVLASVLYFRFLQILPFSEGNIFLARILVELVLQQEGEKHLLIAISSLLVEEKNRYLELIEDGKLSEWIQYFVPVLLQAQETTRLRVEFLTKKFLFFSRMSDKLNVRQKKAMALIFHQGVGAYDDGFKAKEYIKLTGTSIATATRDLRDLAEKGVLRRQGERKATKYWLDL